MISYYLVDPDQDSSKYQKLGEIAESKFKNLGNGKEGSLKKIQLGQNIIIKKMKSLLKKNLVLLLIEIFQQLETLKIKT